MSEAIHTPGPWEIEWQNCECEPPCGCGNPFPYSLYAPNRMVKPYKDLPMEAAEIVNFIEVNEALPIDELRANAALLSAAPNLLEACKALYAALQDAIRRPMGVVPDSAYEAMKLHDDAIAKATTPL